MTEPTYLSEAEAKLHSFQNARQELQNSLSEVEDQIAKSKELRDAILAALDESGAGDAVKKAPAKKAAPAKKTTKKAAAAEPTDEPVVPEVPNEDASVEAEEETNRDEPVADVADHLPSGDTQDTVINNGGALDDWEPGEVEPANEPKPAKKNSADELNFDEIQF